MKLYAIFVSVGGGTGANGRKMLGHSLVPSQYTMKTECEQCKSLLWGIGTMQGYQCKHCQQNFHKSCINSIGNECHTDKTKGIFCEYITERRF